jgi:GMP synthase-like glutamine amidotransferase
LGLLENKLLNNNWKLDVRPMYRPDAALPANLDQHQAMIILGGPMGANDVAIYSYLRRVEELVREATQRNIPTVGICLGAQIIARALGAKVGPNPVKEIGWSPIVVEPRGQVSRLFQQMPPMFSVFQWHEDSFSLPEGAVLLASSEKCRNQAFRYEKSTWAIQFHLEVTPEMIKTWCQEYTRELNEYGGPGAAENLLRNTQARWEPMKAWREQFLDNVAEIIMNGLVNDIGGRF